jgi:PE family
MSQVMVIPEALHTAAADLANIGLNVEAAHKVAAAPTTAILPAAADEVSGAIAKVFAQHAANYQALAGQAAAFNDQFAQHLTAAASAYTEVEAALAALLQQLPANLNGFVSTLATTQPELLFLFSILLVAILSALLFVTVPPLLAVVLPLVFVVVLPFSIAGLALIFGAPILGVLLAELGAAFASFGI